MEEEQNKELVNNEESIDLVIEPEMPKTDNPEDEMFGRELTSEELDQLNAEQRQRYSICHPDRCPNVGRPMPHTPHVPLYPTDWC